MKESYVKFKSYSILSTLSKEMVSAVKEMYQIHMMLLDRDKRNVWFHVSDRVNPNNRFYIQLTIIPNIKLINGFVDTIPGFRSDKMVYDIQYELKMNFINSTDEEYKLVSLIFEDVLNDESENNPFIPLIPNLKTFFVLSNNDIVYLSKYILDITCFSPQYIRKEVESDNYEAQIQYPEFNFANLRLLRSPHEEYLCIGFEYSVGYYVFPNREFDKVFSLSKQQELDIFENEQQTLYYLNFKANVKNGSPIHLYDINDISHAMQALKSLKEAMMNMDVMRYIDGLIKESIKKSNEFLLWESGGPIKPRLIKIYKTIDPRCFIPVGR